jgi:hypothetical protein
VATTKGTGGDCLILEEAAYCDPGFFYETVAPLLLVGRTSLLCISTLTGEYNFYTRLFKQIDPMTGKPIFYSIQIQLSCAACIAEGVAHECQHMLHLVPRWQSSTRHVRLKTIMEDRPDLIQSELAGLAADSTQQVFRSADIATMFSQPHMDPIFDEPIFLVIDPAAGGPQSDYAFISMTRTKGCVQVLVLLCVSLVWARTALGQQVVIFYVADECCMRHALVHDPGQYDVSL